MPRVASEPNLVHAAHRHLGPRSGSAGNDAGEATSPFALLVDSAQTPPPEKDHPAARAPTSRLSSSEHTPPQPCTDPPSLPAPVDEATSEVPSFQIPEPMIAPVESIDVATAGKAPAACAEDATAAQADTLEATVVVATASPVDATAPQPTPAAAPAAPPPPPSAPSPALPDSMPMASGAIPKPVGQPNGADEAKPADLPSDVQVPGGTTPAGANPDGRTHTGASSDGGASADTSADGTASPLGDKPLPAHIPIVASQAGPKGQVEQTKASARARTQPADATAADLDGTDAATGGQRPPTQPGEPTPTDAQPASAQVRSHEHERIGAPKADDLSLESVGAQVSEAARGGGGSSQAVHAVLQANDQPAGPIAPAATTAAPAASEPLVPVAGLAVEIAARAQNGRNRFEIRLDPPELGRIDVQLDIDRGGQVTSRLVVERADTLEHLRRDAADLQRALEQAGLKTADSGLQFALRDQGFAGRDASGSKPDATRLIVPDPDLPAVDTLPVGYGRTLRAGGGIDIRV